MSPSFAMKQVDISRGLVKIKLKIKILTQIQGMFAIAKSPSNKSVF